MDISIFAIADRLKETFTDPEGAHAWLMHPNPYLGNETPLNLIRTHEWNRVLGALEAIDSGICT